MANFIFNANKRKLAKPQTNRNGSILKDVYGNPLTSVQVLFDTPAMKTEALSRMKHIYDFYQAAPHYFPEYTQSGLDPKAELTSDLMNEMHKRFAVWINGAEVFEAFIVRCNDWVDYIKAHQTDKVFQHELETDYAIRITARKRVKIPVRTNLNDLIELKT